MVVPDRFEKALLDNELAGGDAITWTFDIHDGSFTLSYAVKGIDATGVDTGAPGTYTATESSITFVDSGGWRTTADWELSKNELRLSVGDDVAHEFINGVPWKWYATYLMSEPFTRVT